VSKILPRPPSASPPSATRVVSADAFPGGFGFRIVSLAVLAVIGILLGFLVFGGHGGSSTQTTKINASAATPERIAALAASAGHPVFWLGTKTGMTYELSRQPNGSVFVRYLPQGATVGSTRPYLTVATYPFTGAFGAVKEIAGQSTSRVVHLPGGALAVIAAHHPDSVHVAYPGLDYQVEVYDPAPGRALGFVRAHELVAFGSLKPPAPAAPAAAGGPRRVTPVDLRKLAASLRHPLYWLGPKPGYTYELTQSGAGQVYIRYLPAGVAVGAPQPYLTVGTYPYRSASSAIHALAKHHGVTSLPLAGGGLGVLDPSRPKSIHLAFPGSDYEVEVFDPTSGVAKRLVASGEVSAIG
jgi:hypothetical protein